MGPGDSVRHFASPSPSSLANAMFHSLSFRGGLVLVSTVKLATKGHKKTLGFSAVDRSRAFSSPGVHAKVHITCK